MMALTGAAGWRVRLHRHRSLLIPVLLMLATLMVFWPVCGADFVNYDDGLNVYENDLITGFSLANLLHFWTAPYQGLYLPLTYTLWGLLAKVSMLLPAGGAGHLQPWLFHGANLVLHGAAAVVLCQILRLTVRHDWAAAVGALLFAVHPVQVEAVAWVTGLKDVLCGLFSLLALWQYLSYGERVKAGLPGSRRCYGLALLFFVAALLAKPGAVTIPLLAAALGYFLMQRPARQLARELGPFVLLALPAAFATKLFQPDASYTFVPALWQRFLIAGDALSFYLGKVVLPWTLAPDYGRTPEYVLARGWAKACSLLPYLLAGLLCWRYRRPWALAAVSTFAAGLLPVLGFMSFHFQDISTVADRYLYVAMLGPALALAWWLSRYPQVRWGWIGAGCLLVVLGIKSAVQVGYWQDSLTFNSYVVQANPRSATGYINLGVAYRDVKQIDRAIAAYQKAIELDPRNLEAYLNLGDIYRQSGNSSEALSNYALGLGLRPDFAKGYANLGLLYESLHKREEAIAAYRKAIALKPGFAEVYNNLGLIFEKEDTDEAIAMYQKALAVQPDLGEAANNLGLLYLGLQRHGDAIPLFQQAIAAYPDNPLPYNNLGLAYFNLGQFSEAAGWFQQAITVQPSFAPAFNNLSRVELQLGRLDSALEYADKAKALGFSDPEHFEALMKHGR